MFRALHPFNRENLFYEVTQLILFVYSLSDHATTLCRSGTSIHLSKSRKWRIYTTSLLLSTDGAGGRPRELFIVAESLPAMSCPAT